MVEVREIAEMEPGLTEAMARLLPQLSSSAPPLEEATLAGVVTHEACHFLVAEEDGRLLGSLTLVVFPIPTGIRAYCNVQVRADLAAALQEVATTYPSLVAASANQYFTGIDVANTNNAGGCAVPGQARLSRITQALGSVSRHSWGQPLDTSTVANCQGCTPKMDCRIVRIFRKHGFAWGGNFLTPDGMHFEWVGEPRNTLQYPSKYCANLPGGALADTGEPPPDSRSIMFADDGLTAE